MNILGLNRSAHFDPNLLVDRTDSGGSEIEEEMEQAIEEEMKLLSDEFSHHGCRVSVEEVEAELGALVLSCFHASLIQKTEFSYHYFEHRAEDLCVLCYTTYVGFPREDRRMVILIPDTDVDLGCVSCKKQME